MKGVRDYVHLKSKILSRERERERDGKGVGDCVH